MKSVIFFNISKGDAQYVATANDLTIVSQAPTLDALVPSVREAVDLHFEGEDLEDLGFCEHPAIVLNFALPEMAYA